MRTKEDFKGTLLNDIKRGFEIWDNAPETATLKESEIFHLQRAAENIEEATSIVAVDAINRFLNTYILQNQMAMQVTGLNLGISNEEQLQELMHGVRPDSLRFIPKLRDQIRQEIYEKMGFEGILPTHEEIRQLESLRENCESEEERLEVEKKIELKRVALAEYPGQLELGLPHRLSLDVEETYEKLANFSHQI